MGNFAFDLAEQRADQERQSGIAAAHKALQGDGEIFCVACGEEIDQARRVALPAARRCIDCQKRRERFKGRHGCSI